MTSSIPKGKLEAYVCANCYRLMDDPKEFEPALPGILILSSGHGESRGDQRLCRTPAKLATPQMSYERFNPRGFR